MSLRRTLIPWIFGASLLASCAAPSSSLSQASTPSEASSESLVSTSPSVSSSEEETSGWNKSIRDMFLQVVGTEDIPYYEAESYAADIKEETSGSYTQQFVQVDCSPVDYGRAAKLYKTACEEADFAIYEGYEDPIAYKDISVTDTLYIQYYVTQETYTLTLLVYRVTERYAEWPSEQAKIVCGGEVPMAEATSYSLSLTTSSASTPEIYGLAYGVNAKQVEGYADLLQKDGWSVDLDGTYDIYTADNEDSGVRIMFYSYDESSMEFMAYNTSCWKYGKAVVEYEYGFVLPEPDIDDISSYYQDVTISDGSTVFTLYIENATAVTYQGYLAKLLSDGWSIEEPEEETSSTIVSGSNVLTKTIGNTTHEIGYYYSETYSTIAIAIYC